MIGFVAMALLPAALGLVCLETQYKRAETGAMVSFLGFLRLRFALGQWALEQFCHVGGRW